MSLEDKIRNYLADNLSFIDNNLKLIQTEFKLLNRQGSKGFIDILAKDQYNNYVIIEVKRSKATSREAMQELLKYVGLLKQNFRARDSEIKLIVISTDWEELLVPYSELLDQTSLDVKGYKIYLDNFNNPTRKEIIKPVAVFVNRSLAKSSFLHLFYTESKRDTCIDYIVNKCTEIGLIDYLLLKLNHESSSAAEFSFALCFAFQSLSLEEYNQIFNYNDFEVDMESDEFDELSEYLHYLEQNIIVLIDASRYDDGAEAGFPEKLDSVLGTQNWKVQQIMRFGFFATDPRYNEEILLRELRGLDGNNRIRYINFGESSHKHRLEEVRQSCLEPLYNNSFWRAHLKQIFDYLEQLGKPYRFVINVYQPDSVFDHIWRAMILNNPDYLPVYLIFVDFIEENLLWIFDGRLIWNGRPIDLEALVDYLTEDTDATFNKFLDAVNGDHDDEIMQLYNLSYENTLVELKDEILVAEASVRFEDNQLLKLNSNSIPFFEWLDQNDDLKEVLSSLYEEYTINI